MQYFGFTKGQIDHMVTAFNKISVTGLEQQDLYHDATTILRNPTVINTPDQEGEKKDGKEIHKTELAE